MSGLQVDAGELSALVSVAVGPYMEAKGEAVHDGASNGQPGLRRNKKIETFIHESFLL